MRKRAAKSLLYRLRTLGSKGSTLRNDAANIFNEYLLSTVPTLFKASDTEMKSIVLVFRSWLQEYVYIRSEGWETGLKKKTEGMREKQLEVCIQVIKEVILFHKWDYRWECLKWKYHSGLDIISFRRSTEQWEMPLKQQMTKPLQLRHWLMEPAFPAHPRHLSWSGQTSTLMVP